MGLIACADCGNECSDQAATCPNCGRPVGEPQSLVTKDLGFGGALYALIALAGLLLMLSGNLGGFLFVLIGGILLAARLKIWTGVGRK